MEQPNNITSFPEGKILSQAAASNTEYEDLFNAIYNNDHNYNRKLYSTRPPFFYASPDELIADSLPLIIGYIAIFLLGLVGNLLVILTLGFNRSMRTAINVYFLNLAVSDLLLGLFCMPFTLIGVIHRSFIFGEIMCRIIPYSQGKDNFAQRKTFNVGSSN